MAIPTSQRRSRSLARSSGERSWRKVRAVWVTRAARLSGPTAVASKTPAPSTTKEPDHTSSPAALTTGSDSPVRFDSSTASPSRVEELPVGDDLVAARQADDVAGHNLVDRHAPRRAVPDHRRLRGDERCEPVERALRADLLERPDRDVRDQDPDEERVLPRRERERQDAEREQDPVRDVDRVREDDAPVGAARPLPRKLSASRQAARRLGLTQSGGCDGHGGDGRTLQPVRIPALCLV